MKRQKLNFDVHSIKESNLDHKIVPIIMTTIGIGIAGIWTSDILSGKFSDQGNFFAWKEGESLLWPHITAEYLTSAGLIAGSIGLFTDKDWAISVSLFSLGSVTYSAINSSGWVLYKNDRLKYGIPMWLSLSGSAISFILLLK